MAGKNFINGNSCFLFAIPAYASNIYKVSHGLAGEITVPPNCVDFWNCTGTSIKIDGKNCLELSSTNEYRFDKYNLLEYMKMVRQEYSSNVLHKYTKYERKSDLWKNVNEEGWRYRNEKIRKTSFDVTFDLYMKPTADTDAEKRSRYYISSKSEQYIFIITYCLIPRYTNIRIKREKIKSGKSIYTFYLEAVGFENTQKYLNDEFEKKNMSMEKHQLGNCITKQRIRGIGRDAAKK